MMNRKLLLGILVVLGIAVTVLNPLMSLVLAVGVWMYLVMMVRKHKDSVLNDQMEPTITEWHLRRLRTLLIVAAFSFLVFSVAAIVHNVSHDLSEIENTVSFLIALVALWVSVMATAAGMVLFLKGRRRTT
jgi:phosphate/sulfate permease